MKMMAIWLMLLFDATGLLILGLSVPLAQRRVRPNRWYGFRTPKTLSDERIWYEANAYAGRMLAYADLAFLAAVAILFFVMRANFIAYNIACLIALTGSVLTATALSFRRLRSL